MYELQVEEEQGEEEKEEQAKHSDKGFRLRYISEEEDI